MNFDSGSESETDLRVCVREGWGERERVTGGGEAKSMKIISQEPRITQKTEMDAEGDGSKDGGEGPL